MLCLQGERVPPHKPHVRQVGSLVQDGLGENCLQAAPTRALRLRCFCNSPCAVSTRTCSVPFLCGCHHVRARAGVLAEAYHSEG